MAEFAEEARALEEAQCAIRKKINEAFPAGTKVVVKVGRGFVYGEVKYELSIGTEVCVLNQRTGWCHRHFYGDVSYA